MNEIVWRWFPGTAVFAISMAVVHVAAPRIRRALQGRESIVASLGGGMAAAYVFVHLLPELDQGNALLGRMIFVLSLVSFVIYYGMSTYMQSRSELQPAGSQASSSAAHSFFPFKLAQLWIYNWLIIYGTPADVAESGWHGIGLIVAMALHLMHSDYELGTQYPQPFDARGRLVLATAPLAGWISVVLDQKTNQTVNDILVALLAGIMLYSVFREQIPDHRESRFWWFFLGAAGFVFFVAISMF